VTKGIGAGPANKEEKAAKLRRPAAYDLAEGTTVLLNGASDLREHVVGIRPDKANCANHDDENYSQHYCVFGDILATFVVPKLH
jgi:hypothetical protein